MAVSVIMPKAGMAMETGTILKWLKEPGDPVAKGEPLLEIETDKVSMEVEAEADGVLLAVTRGEGDVVPVTETIGYIGREGEPVPEAEAPGGMRGGAAVRPGGRIPATPAARRLAREKAIGLGAVRGNGPSGAVRRRDVEAALGVKASPLARRLAGRHGVILAELAGTGPGGKITKDDVLGAAGEPAAGEPRAGAPAAPGEPLSKLKRITGQRMLASHREIPPVTLQAEADVTELLALRKRLNAKRERRISINDFVLRAAARTVKEQPAFRASLVDGRMVVHGHVHIGMAVALDDGLIVPVIRDADALSVEELAEASRGLAEKARTGRLSLEELEGAVFTVTNLGMYGVTAFTPIINPPQSAILGVCAVRDAAVPGGGEAGVPEGGAGAGAEGPKVVFCKRMTLSLTIDHRLLDGAQGALFLKTLTKRLEHPAGLMAVGRGQNHD